MLRDIKPLPSFGAALLLRISMKHNRPIAIFLAFVLATGIVWASTTTQTTPLFTAPMASAFTDRSSTITVGGTAQTLAAQNLSRRYLIIQNTSSGDEWVSWTTSTWVSTSVTAGWIKIPSGGSYDTPASAVTSQAFTIWGATTGQSFTSSEM
jgi:hypothetical protein